MVEPVQEATAEVRGHAQPSQTLTVHTDPHQHQGLAAASGNVPERVSLFMSVLISQWGGEVSLVFFGRTAPPTSCLEGFGSQRVCGPGLFRVHGAWLRMATYPLPAVHSGPHTGPCLLFN